jgi:mannose-6-phosphate isomerase-like protein (cupin superfamily)
MNAPSDEITIVKKPWGREIIYARCEHYLGKVIEISEGHRLSLQAHVEKDETIYVLEGRLALTVGASPEAAETRDMQPGEAFRIRPGTVHRFAAPYGAVRVLEVSTPHPDDVVRFSDDYGRSSD